MNAAAAVGADFAGVDLALTDEGATVLEANVCPGFRGFSRLTGVDVAARLIEALIARTQKEGRVEALLLTDKKTTKGLDAVVGELENHRVSRRMQKNARTRSLGRGHLLGRQGPSDRRQPSRHQSG